MAVPFGKYLLESKLAEGGMAEIFLARQAGIEGFEREVVVKRLLPDLSIESDFVRMFLNEARLAARLNHPNIVQIFELGQEEGAYYLAMEYIRGEDLRGLRFHVEGAWGWRSDDVGDFSGTAYPYGGEVELMETYAEYPRARGWVRSVKAGRYRTPFGISNASRCFCRSASTASKCASFTLTSSSSRWTRRTPRDARSPNSRSRYAGEHRRCVFGAISTPSRREPGLEEQCTHRYGQPRLVITGAHRPTIGNAQLGRPRRATTRRCAP